ncbi:neprilysin [Rhipicephalus sanguineus]|uniref:Endothelin-converting enzyme n=1 Tax=Rhipicephalus sanguineus TaxID=34632 RepID=A0A9D4T608_RHISA|nr:neprilysin [Rhipicephalus sanguineus]KAH7972795.1 hypothetical protein HPB52_017176 [Rhipicephalus sanguineus]
MSKKLSRQGRSSIAKEASRNERPPAAASDVEPTGASHSFDRDLEKTSRSGDSLRAAEEATKPPRHRRRQSSTVAAPDKPNEANDLSSAYRSRGAVRRQQRTSGVIPPYSSSDRELVTAPFVAVTATDATAGVPEQPGEPRRTGAGHAICSGTPSEASHMPKTLKEEPALLTSDLDKAMDAPEMPGEGRRTGGTDGKPLDEGPVRAPDNPSAVAVTRDTAPSTSKEPGSTARTPVRQAAAAAESRRSAFTRSTLRFTSGRRRQGTGRGMPTGEQPRLEDLLQVSPKKEKVTVTHPRFHRRAFIGAAALLAVLLALVLFALYQGLNANGRVAYLCGTPDCIEHVHALGIDTGRNSSPCQSFGCFVCSGWSNDFRHVNGSVTDQAILQWFASVVKLSFGDFDRHAVINRPLSMMRRCMSSTTDEENAVRMLTAFVSERSFAWPTPGEPEKIVDNGKALAVVLELSVVWALPLWFHVHLLPAAPSARLQRDRAVLLRPSTPSLLGRFAHETLSKYQDGYSLYTYFLMDTLFTLRPPSESFKTFLTTRSGVVQGQIFHELASAINDRLPQPMLVQIGSLPKLVRNLSAKDWVRALRSVYGTRAQDITENDLVLATNNELIKAVDSAFASHTAQEIFFHTVWWFVQALGTTVSTVLRSSVNNIPEGAYFQRLICFYHVDTVFNALLASINKAMLSTESRLAITTRLEHIRSVVVEKLRAYSKLNAETRRALSAIVESMSTVIWPEDDFGRPGGFEEYFGKPYNGSDDGFYAEWEWSRLQIYNRDKQAAVAIGDYVAASEVFAFAGSAVTHYNPVLNVISISVAALRPPFYYGEATSAMFYGGLGFIYAEGIFRAVDMLAHLLNGDNMMAPSESAATSSFWNASWCSDVRDAERTFPWLPALDAAYTTYLRFKDEASDLRLKGLSEYSPAQVFFATFCHGNCWTDTSKAKFSRTCTDATRNFGPFKEAFSCATDATDNCAYV